MHTWIQEFYPVPAEDAARSDAEAIKHSLQKWIGLRPENLKRHGVERIAGDLYAKGEELQAVDAKSCALCKRHLKDEYEDSSCETCPLYKLRDTYACDECSPDESIAPFQSYTIRGNPEPMIALLQQALDRA